MTSRPDGTGLASSLARAGRELALLIVSAAVIAFLLKSLVAQAFYIPSESMSPQLAVDDRVIVSRLSYRLHDPHRGDIVVFDCPRESCPDDGAGGGNPVARLVRGVAEGLGVVQPSTEEYIKRVVGLPGETVESRDGRVYVDGRRLVEPYLAPNTATLNLPPTRVPEGHLVVLGDNRSNSSDSRVFGPIPESSLVGRTVLKIWPPADASFL